MSNLPTPAPEGTAVRVALWRAMHVQVDAPPHVLDDEVGLELVAPDPSWRTRPDMNEQATRRSRASIVARARFIEDRLEEQVGRGVVQYVILGAGLDSFAQRRPELASRLRIFEVDQPGPQAWKRQRLNELGLGIPDWLRLTPVDFEAGASFGEGLAAAGFEAQKPTFVASTGVIMYLTEKAIVDTLKVLAAFSSGSCLAMSFMLPLDCVEPEEQRGRQAIEHAARASGHPFLSFFRPHEIMALAREAGFRQVEHVSAQQLTELYFAGRTDGLRPASSEELILATV